MSEAARGLRKRLLERAVTTEPQRAAYAGQAADAPTRHLIETIAGAAAQVTDADVAAVRAAGRSEDEVFELAVCAALGQATRQLDAAFAALDAATREPA